MKMNKRIIISIIAILALTIGVGYALWQSNETESDTTQEDPSQPITEADEREKREESSENQEYIEESEENVSSTPSNGSSSPSPEPSDSRTRVNTTLTSLSQNSQNVSIRAIVDGATSGTCTVELRRSGHSTITRSAPIAQQGTYYACQGFDIAKSNFPAKGEWTAVVKFSSNSAVGQSRTETININ